MKIAIASDLHLEFGDLDFHNDENADVLILSGDILIAQELHDHPPLTTAIQDQIMDKAGTRRKLANRYRGFLQRCSERFPHVVYVAGNHEFYHGKWVQNIQDLRDECARYSNIHFLERDTVTINDLLFVGGTLWTNMNKEDPLTLHSVRDMMSDFHVIRNDSKGHRTLSCMDTAVRHRTTLDYFRTILENNKEKKVVVVGHHAPSSLSVHQKYADDTLMNGAYYSDLSEFILDHPQICLWTHGHTHEQFDYMLGDTRVVCNPRGYIGHEYQANEWKLKYIKV